MYKIFLLAVTLTVGVSASGHELFFIENKGQVVDQFYHSRKDIDFVLRSSGMSMFIGDGHIHYQFRRPVREDTFEPIKHKIGGSVEMYRLDVELVGADIGAPLITSERQGYYEQYYMPQFGPEGMLANAYHKVIYKDIYPHIDQVFYIQDGNVEQDFIVNEGGDPTKIKIKYNGASGLQLNEDGSFTATTPMGNISEVAPTCYDAKGNIIKSAYSLDGNVLSFNIDSYSGTITIDPTLVWEKHIGGAGYDDVSGLDHDGQGGLYITGENEGSNIATTGAYQGTFAGVRDGYFLKYTSAGNSVWGTFFGGPDEDQPFKAICKDGAVYIHGITRSPSGIASPGAHQTILYGTFPYNMDAFLAKFSSTGSRVWSTYYGGSSWEEWGDIYCDNDGNVYMVGTTGSVTGIATPGSHRDALAAAQPSGNGFLVKFDPSGVRQWATYYGGDGGSSADYLRGVACDNANNIYIVGVAESSGNIATPGSYQENIQGAGLNGLIAKFNSSGNRIWGTYYHSNTYVQSVTCDPQGNFFIAGNTMNQTDIATPGAFQSSYAGGNSGPTVGDSYITKFNGNGQRLWSTYLGGNDQEYTERINSDALGHVYVVGSTKSSSDFPLVNAYQPTWGGGTHDGFFAKFSNNGLCMWSSYIGKTFSDGCHDVAIEDDHTFYVGSLSAPSNNSNASAYFARFSDNSAGVRKIENSKLLLAVYPNPANETLNIKGINVGDELTITDVLGRSVHILKITRSDIEHGIEVKELSSGLYFVNWKGTTAKFIKQ